MTPRSDPRRSAASILPANGAVGPIHPSTMPVLLTTREEWRTWLEAPTEVALELQRPLPDAMMRIVATGSPERPMSVWWWLCNRQEVAEKAEAVIAAHGTLAYAVAREQARAERKAGRWTDARFWARVAVEIAEKEGWAGKIGADRWLSD